MAMTFLPSILENAKRHPQPPQSGIVSDAQLLERFLHARDEAAFELLMWRHGPMVFGVCRRVLRHTQDAEDAFQATFLMLARKAASIGKRASVSGWLYTVAYRIALRARMRGARRGQFEKSLDEPLVDRHSSDPADVAAWRELRRLLDAELSQVPEKYRTAFILCHLEGKTCDEAAEQLGCPRGTVQSRVGRARERLRERLARRGWLPATMPLTDLLEQHVAPLTNLAPAMIYATVNAALLAALGKALAGVVSPSVLDLMKDTLRAMYWRRWRNLAILAVLMLLGSSAVVWRMVAAPSPWVPPALPPTADQPASSCHGPSSPQSP